MKYTKNPDDRELPPVEDYIRCKYCGTWTPPNQMAGPTSKVCQFCIDEVNEKRALRAERQRERSEITIERREYLKQIRNG